MSQHQHSLTQIKEHNKNKNNEAINEQTNNQTHPAR